MLFHIGYAFSPAINKILHHAPGKICTSGDEGRREKKERDRNTWRKRINGHNETIEKNQYSESERERVGK